MTVSSTLAKISYAGNDSNTSFSFSFTVFANTDLVVTFTNSSGVESTLTEGTGTSNYSVSVSSYPGTGSITWPASGSTKLQSNEKITIKRVLPLTQTIDLQNQGGYFPDVQETGFDKSVYLSQQIDEEVDRSIKIPVSSATSIDSTLPAPTADTVIGAWNSDADAIVAGPTVANITAAESNATAAAASAVTAAAEASAANPKYTFSTSTSMADPGAGTLRYNHSSVSSTSAIAIDDTTADTGNPDIEAWLKTWDDSTSTVKGWLRLVEPGTPANYAVFHVTGLTDSSGFIQLAVTHIDSNGTFGNGDSIRVMFSRSGDKGDTGSQGIQGIQGDEAGVLPYVFATSTSDADPGAGKLRFNHGTLSSISQIFIGDQSNASGNPDVSALLLTYDDSTNVNDKGTIVVSKKSALQNYFIGRLTSLVDASGYVKLVATHVTSNGSFSADDDLLVEFQRTGNAGSLDDPMTTRGDIIARNSSNATARLGVGSANTVLSSDGTDISYGFTVGTSANNLVQLNGSAALPAVSGANLTNLPVSDLSGDLRNIALGSAADRITLLNGIVDPLTDETDVSAGTITEEGGTANTGNTHSGDGTFVAQRFTASQSGKITGVKFAVAGADFGSGCEIRIETSDGTTTPTGTLVDSAAVLTTSARAQASVTTFYQEDFTTPFDVVAGTVYWIVVGRNGTETFGLYRITSGADTGTGAVDAGTFQADYEMSIKALIKPGDSVNQTFTSTSGGYYNGFSTSVVAQGTGTAIGNATEYGGLASAFDSNLSQAWTASASPAAPYTDTFIGKDWGSGNTKIITSVKVYSSSSHNISGGGSDTATFTIQGSTDNFSSSTVDLGTGNLTIGAGGNATLSATDLSTAFRYHRIHVTRTTAAGVIGVAELIFTEQTMLNVTLISTAYTATSAPSKTILGIQTVESGTVTLNTDLKGYVSRDGGSNFTEVTLALKTTLGQTGTKYYECAETTISSTSGSSMVWKITTHNNKNVQIHGVALSWS